MTTSISFLVFKVKIGLNIDFTVIILASEGQNWLKLWFCDQISGFPVKICQNFGF